MNIDALALVMIGALIHASWNYFAKKSSGGVCFVWLYGMLSLAFAIPVVFVYWILYPELLGLTVFLVALISALLHILYSLVLQQGYRVADFSVVYPLARGTGPLFSVLGAILVLTERPSEIGWLGICLILLGILMLAGGGKLAFAITTDVRLRKGIGWGLLTGLFIAAYTLVDGWSVKVLALSPVFFYALGLVFRALLLTPFVIKKQIDLQKEWQQNRKYIFAVGVLSPLAYLLVLYAMTKAPLSYVAPTRELSMMIGAFFGAKLFNEQNLKSRMVGMVLMVTGIFSLTQF